jgi:hypothetical protein
VLRYKLRTRTVHSHGRHAFSPLFIVGCPRSGTTLLQRMLDTHPEMAIAPETHFIRRFWVRRDEYGDLRDEEAFGRLVSDVLSIPEVADMRLNTDVFRTATARIERSVPALFALLLESFRAQRDAKLVGEKTPNHLLYMETLQRFFPGCRFIHIIRDPRAVVASWRNVPWSSGSTRSDTHVWRRYIRSAWKQRLRGGALHVVRYESLVTAPEATLRRICRFVGLDFSPAMLTYHQVESSTLNLEREPWKRGAAVAVYERSTVEWRNNLSPTEVAEIERIAGVEMMWLGYRFSTTRQPWISVGDRLLRAAMQRWLSE